MAISKILLKESYYVGNGRVFLTEADAKDIITNKLGLSPKVYSLIQDSVDKKFHIVVGNIIKRLLISENITDLTSVNRATELIIERFNMFRERVLKVDNRPIVDIKELTYSSMLTMIEQIDYIMDYKNGVTPPPNLRNKNWEQAYNESVQWHEELARNAENNTGLSKDIMEIAPNAEIIHTFEDGYKWIDLHTRSCKELGSTMGHCATTNKADTLLQLVTDKGKFVVTVAFDYDGTYYQMKGTGNTKPIKYEEWILWLFTNGGEYQLTEKKSEYQSEEDFTVEDITDENVKEQILNDNEGLSEDTIEKFLSLYRKGSYTKEEAISAINRKVLGYYDTYNIEDISEDGTEFTLDNPQSLKDIFDDLWDDAVSPSVLSFGDDAGGSMLMDDIKYEVSDFLRNGNYTNIFNHIKINIKSEKNIDSFKSLPNDIKEKIIINAKNRYGNTILSRLQWNRSDDYVIEDILDAIGIKTDGINIINFDIDENKVSALHNDFVEFITDYFPLKYKEEYFYPYIYYYGEYYDDNDVVIHQFTHSVVYEDLRTNINDDLVVTNSTYPLLNQLYENWEKYYKKYYKEVDLNEIFLLALLQTGNSSSSEEVVIGDDLIQSLIKYNLISTDDINGNKLSKDPNQLALKFEHKLLQKKLNVKQIDESIKILNKCLKYNK